MVRPGFDRIRHVGRNLRRRPTLLALVCVAAVVTLAAGAWMWRTALGNGEPAPLPTGAASSVNELYRRVESAISRPGFALHQTVTTKHRGLLGGGETTEEIWGDAAWGVLREETHSKDRGGERRNRWIILGNVRYSDGRGHRMDAFRCGGGSAVVSRVLACDWGIDPKTLSLGVGVWEGRTVLVLTQHGSHAGEWPVRFVENLYVSPETYLPIAKEMEGTVDIGAPLPIKTSSSTEYRHEFVATDTLAANLFDPQSIGARAEPNLRRLNRAGPVYWLGERYAGHDRLPPLRLEWTKAARGHRGLVLSYGFTVGGNASKVEVEHRGLALGGAPGFFADPCARQQSLDVPAGRATLYSIYVWEHADPPTDTMGNPGCSRPPTDHAAIVQTDNSVVVITIVSAGRGKNPYRAQAGMEALARDLTLRTKPR